MAAAAGADLGEIDRRHLQRVARAGQQPRADHDAGADGILLGARDLAVLDHRGLGRRAAHVEGDDLLELLGARPAPGRRPRRRPGPDSMMFIGRSAAARVGREAAVRLHQQQARRNAGAVEPLAQRPQIGRDDRHHIGVDDRGRGALVLLDLGQHLAGDAERQVRRLAGDDVAQHQLVRRIGEGVQQADRRSPRPSRPAAHRPRARRRPDRAARSTLPACVDPLVDHPAQIALDQRRAACPRRVVEPGHAQRADLQHVAKALGGDQADARALVLEDRVGGDRGAVADLLDGAAVEAGLARRPRSSPSTMACGVVADARRDLLGVDGAVGAEQHDVGEGAADVDADAVGHG